MQARMQWDLTRLALPAARRTWLHLGGPRPSEIEAKTRKNWRWKTTRFWDRFCKGSDIVFQGFLIGFLDPKSIAKKQLEEKRPRPILHCKHQYEINVGFCNKQQKSNKNQWKMFFGTSILKGFWHRFGRGLGSQNHWFSHFFRCFSMQNLDCNLEGQKIEKKSHKATDFCFLAQGRRWSPGSWGEKKRGV